MVISQKILSSKSLKLIVCIMLCITTITFVFMQHYIEAECVAPALVIAGWMVPEAVTIIGALLCAAGLTWAVDTAIEATVEWYVSSVAPSIRDALSEMVNNAEDGIAEVSEEIWESATTWVNTNYDVGENIKESLYFDGIYQVQVGEDLINYYLPMNYNDDGTAVLDNTRKYVKLEIDNLTLGLDTYTVDLVEEADYSWIKLYKNGDEVVNYKTNKNFTPYFFLMASSQYGTIVDLCLRAYHYSTGVAESIKLPIYKFTSGTLLNMYEGARDITAIGQEVVDTTHDILNQEGKREIGFPTTLTGLVDKTYEDVINPDIENPPVDSPAEELTGSWWENLLGNIISPVLAWLQTMVQSITGVQTAVQEADITNMVRDYKLPDLFILILKVILACIRLILRAIVFIATLPAIPADAGDINGDFLSGINFLKNQTIPFFNITLWQMATGIIGILFGLAVVKRVRRLYHV